MGEDADLEREDLELEPLEVLEPDEGRWASAEAWDSSWARGWGWEAGAPAVDGMTWAVGMGIWLRMGWNDGLLQELWKSSDKKQQCDQERVETLDVHSQTHE